MPGRQKVSEWATKNEVFSGRIARARDEGFDVIAAECLKIADTQEMGGSETTKEWGVERKREDMLGHRKLQIETRLKLLAKWDPKRYGEKLDVNATLVEGPIPSNRML